MLGCECEREKWRRHDGMKLSKDTKREREKEGMRINEKQRDVFVDSHFERQQQREKEIFKFKMPKKSQSS